MGDTADLLKKCGRSCPGHVKVRKLTEKEVAEFTSAGTTQDTNLNNLTYTIRSKHSLRDVPSVKTAMFDSYKKRREQFLNKRPRRSSSEMTESSSFSGDEFSEASDEEYHARIPQSHKKKRLAYEDDLEWSPNSEGKLIPSEKHIGSKYRKIGLRVNTRRKRIESNSSSSSDNDFYYRAESKSDTEKLETPNGHVSISKAVTPVSSLKKKESNSNKVVSNIPKDSSPLIDNDLLSKIIHEMSDYTMKNSKPASKYNGNEEIEKSSVENYNAEITHYPPMKKRRSHLFKITDEDVTPSLTSVQQIVRKMVNHVCTNERKRMLSATGGSRRKFCKWCDARISPVSNCNNSENDLCTMCRSVSIDSKITNKSPVKAKATSGVTKPKVGNKIKSKLYKNLPKYDQQRLAYSGQADKSSVSKGYNHCKSSVTLKDLDLSGVSVVIKSPEKVKIKKKAKDFMKKKAKDFVKKKMRDSLEGTRNSSVKKKKVFPESEKCGNNLKPKGKKLLSSALNKPVGEKKPKQVSVTNVNKGLFLMTFPEPHQELEIPPQETNALPEKDKNFEKPASDATSQNKSELHRNKPKQSLANNVKQSVTNNVQYGNYLLPPVPTVVVANYAATDAKSGDYYLSSVYYQNEMTRSKTTPLKADVMTATTVSGLPSMPSLDQLSTVSQSPSFSFPPCHLNSVPVTEYSLPPNLSTSNSILLQPHMLSPADISIPAYSLQDNADVFNNMSEIVPTSYQGSSMESDIASLLNNRELQIQSLQSKDSDCAFDLFDSQELNLAESFEDSSNMTENCSEDLGVIIKNSVNEGLSAASFDNDSRNSETPTKQMVGNESLDTDAGKVPEENMDPSQNSARNSSAESFFYQSETQNLSSEALLEYCSAELDALCILGVVDLDKNPKWTLKRRIDSNKSEVEKFRNAEIQDGTAQVRLKYLELNGRTLQIASALLNRFGSFTRLSDSILRKQRLLQIKKEKGLEFEETRSSCQFAKSAPPPPIVSQIEPMTSMSQIAPMTSISQIAPMTTISQIAPMTTIENLSAAVKLKMEGALSCDFASRLAQPINHIEKIQTQIQSMQGNSSMAVDPAQLGLVHHFPAPDMPVASNVTFSLTPRTEMMSEFRETPSRGSGPRTPARPESAMSQNDESVLTPQQIKKERLEASNSPLSQCAFSQNTTPSPRIPTSTPNMSQIATVSSLALVPVTSQLVTALTNQRHYTVAPAVPVNSNSQMQRLMQYSVSPAASMNSNRLQIQKVMQMPQGQAGPPNVTVPFPAGNQNFAKVVVNKLPPPLPPSNPMANLNPHNTGANVIVRGNYMNVQPGGQLFQRFVQTSVPAITNNMNSYTYKQTINSGGTMMVNSIGGPNYALSNSQVLNQQVPHVYNAGNVQQSLQVQNSVNQAAPNTCLMPNSKPEDSTPMTCAVCNKPATLRCKQCAKVAYCNTICAKNYWHERHKMECKMMLANV